MAKFRKTVQIEARQWLGTEASAKELIQWMGDGEYYPADWVNSEHFPPYMRIFTLEDGWNRQCKHHASPMDWIIKGVQGEFYACKSNIFAATYEIVVP